MPFAYLDDDDLKEVRSAASDAGFADHEMREALLDGIYRPFRDTLNRIAKPALQLRADLHTLNEVERLIDGSVPLETWLRNATELTHQEGPAGIFHRYLDAVASAAAGEPEPPGDEEIGEIKEAIVHRDDTLPYDFLLGGAEAGKAVAHLRVYPYYGTKRNAHPFVGTGWLIARDLIVTNYHVIQARRKYETPATEEELAMQAAATEVYFDYYTDDQLGPPIGCVGLVASDRDLDYAVLRLQESVDRRPLQLADARIVAKKADYVPVNILQHPQGGPKKVALRNNLVTDTSDNELRYFTDTRPGSSGSPVLDDDWKVVGLHRGSRMVTGIRFQGKDTAYVNIGTQLRALLEHLQKTRPAAADEILKGA